MLLITERNSIDDRLTLVCNPIFLNDIVDFRSSDERKILNYFSLVKDKSDLNILSR